MIATISRNHESYNNPEVDSADLGLFPTLLENTALLLALSESLSPVFEHL